MATNKDFIIKNGLVVGGDITGVTDLYVDDQIISTGDTNTYLQFHSADQFRVVVGGAEKFEVNSTGITVTGTVTATGGNSTNWNTAYTYSQVGHLPLAGGTLSGALIVNKAAESLANQPSIISTFDSSGTDGLALISIEHLTNSGAGALGAGLRFQVGDGSTGTADKQSYIFQRGGTSLPLVYIADKSHQFYVDHHDNNIDGTSYSDYGTLALTLNEAGNVVATGTVTATGGNSTNWNTAYGWGNHAGLYLGATAKAADSNLFDGVDSVLYQRYRADIGNAIDLNTYTTMGIYHQNSNARATSGSNYPISQAGMLTVTANSIFIYQTYQAYSTNGTYERKYYNGTWQSWHLVYDSGVFTNNSTNWNTAYGWGNHASATYATQSYVGTQISNLVDSSPAALNTLNELAAALGDNENFATDVTASIALKSPLASPTFTGTVTTPNLTIGSGNKIKFANNDYIRYDDAVGVGRFHFDADGGTNNASVQAATFVGALSGNATGLSGTPNITVGTIASGIIAVQGIDPGNPSAAADQLRLSGYGVIGNRGSMYLTNSHASGQIVMGISGAHNANPKLTVTTSGITVGGNVTVSGTVDGVDIAARNAILTSTTTTAGAALPKAGGTMTGLLTINATNDNQILLTSPSSWTGIGFNDSASGAAEYIWHNGTNGTFAIGGGGSNVANKKLHVHGGMTIGSGYAATAVSANSLNVEGDINSGNYITGTRLRAGDGTDGYFYSDTAGRTAFIGGDFYIRSEVTNCYLYAANTFMGAASGDTILFRGNVVTADNWGINAAGLITSSGIRTGANPTRVKLGVWNDNTYGIGMQSGYTYGGLNNDYAMTFQMNSDNDRGFWWGDASHTNAQGAMALTTNGLLTVASGIRVGYGETDITIPSAGLVVSGAATFSGRTIMGGDGARVQVANSVAADTSNLYTLAVGSQSGSKSILAARDINTTAGSYQINGTAVIDSSRNMFANDITAVNIERASSRISTSQYYPIGHTSTSENVFDIDPTWSTNDLQAFFQTTAVAWTADATAPGGYAITITGGVSRTTIGHRYIPVETDDEFYMECWIKNVGTGQTHYMGSVDRDQNFGSLGGNPGSYGYWVMANTNPGSSWTKVSGTIGGFGTSVGQFKVGTKYWSPQALFNYGAGSGTRACVISGLKIIRTKVVGNRTFTGNVTAASGILTVQKEGAGGGQIGLGDWTNGNPIGISEGLWNSVGADDDYLTVYTRSSFNIRGYGGGTTYWLQLTNSNLNLVQGQSLSLAGTTVLDSSRNFTGQSYSGVANNASFASNTTTSYGSWRTSGSKGGYDGIVFGNGGNATIMFDSSGNGGLYRAAGGGWYNYYHVGNSCTGFGTSTTSSSYEIYVSGAIYATGNITAYSDRRVKENITTIDNPLTKVEGLRGVYYNKIDDEKKTKQIGFIAQEVDEVVPELVTYAEDVDQYGVNYGNTTALLVEAIKELSQQVKDQQKQIDELKQEVASLRSKI